MRGSGKDFGAGWSVPVWLFEETVSLHVVAAGVCLFDPAPSDGEGCVVPGSSQPLLERRGRLRKTMLSLDGLCRGAGCFDCACPVLCRICRRSARTLETIARRTSASRPFQARSRCHTSQPLSESLKTNLRWSSGCNRPIRIPRATNQTTEAQRCLETARVVPGADDGRPVRYRLISAVKNASKDGAVGRVCCIRYYSRREKPDEQLERMGRQTIRPDRRNNVGLD
ncbi:hypothetical protein LX36DRAFT_79308 [Colletotrichum falcatum]|nr:hypothetical protein LX36DRAFT_79308 [Colletotrichum falcatum]